MIIFKALNYEMTLALNYYSGFLFFQQQRPLLFSAMSASEARPNNCPTQRVSCQPRVI